MSWKCGSSGTSSRSPRQVRLTAAGEVLLRDARTALDAVTAAARRARQAGSPSPRLRVALKADVDGGLLPQILEAYCADDAALPPELVLGGFGEQPQALRDGRADVGLLLCVLRACLGGPALPALRDRLPAGQRPSGRHASRRLAPGRALVGRRRLRARRLHSRSGRALTSRTGNAERDHLTAAPQPPNRRHPRWTRENPYRLVTVGTGGP